MGVDAEIYFRSRDGQTPYLDPSVLRQGKVQMNGNDEMPDATHYIYTLSRYYGEGYERGHWPAICTVLIQLHAHESVERVWYGGDGGDTVPECPPERVLELCAHYMRVGNRPYFNRNR